ncbi:SGT1 protein-domain-containing protein [Aspergillus cavernicola]|uniref:SGT1 protein-domain-containing protein n=1 Tax=Aspergillus cavernicola TaxID=176166 RepID=A0ABR4J4W5_9EURO
MAPMSEEDLEWFKSTFRPIPKPELPDDCIEYSVHYIPSSPVPAVADEAADTRMRLTEVQKSAAELTKELLKDYIWQREGFRLEITKENGTSTLSGRTNFGDSVEDEWVIVYMLRELTKKHKDIWATVTDNDGQFLLAEGAGALPSWLEPEIADNRVWLHQGDLVIIKPKSDKRRVTETISLSEARKIIKGDPNRLMRSTMIQEEAFYRLRNYPKQISENLHSALVTIPRKVAFLLHQKPAYISAAVEAFYLRDPIALRPLRGKDSDDLIFKPEDFVTMSTRFTRPGYGQVKSQDFPAPKAWVNKLPPIEDRTVHDRAETGMKVSCGFEMLLTDPQNQDKALVREMKFILEDLDTGDESLPTDEEIQTWDKREDDEKWLDINFEDLDTELKGRGKSKDQSAGEFGDANAQENLQRIVAQFEKFLNDESAGFEGADFIDDYKTDSDDEDDEEGEDELDSDGEDKEASFDEEEFSKMMKEMMGMPSMSGLGGPSEPLRPRRVEELETDSEDDTEQIQLLSREMEAELKGTGVLDLNRPSEAAQGKHAVSHGGVEEETTSGLEADGGDININLVKNLLESLQGQSGTAGPTKNMLSMMNLPVPKDDRQR